MGVKRDKTYGAKFTSQIRNKKRLLRQCCSRHARVCDSVEAIAITCIGCQMAPCHSSHPGETHLPHGILRRCDPLDLNRRHMHR
ncbi:hypothetical protein M0657_004651 [Pyricularia oryzae]|uniref:Uncharacterized protein n=1 Tax=Pyricularia oryzae TaxID=318829 RepID=A0A4P7N3G0_PYROR|nr:hypothetical protein M0657_004651 [Pyricularia oryzae]KAI7926229.1 hypothetical protein M9X92_002819 [Pyricularia oryzae]QBZ57008.1 hypothetical protein PoMZ_01927 [Pyricularia oryzae]